MGREARPLVAAHPRLGRRADQPRGLELVRRGRRQGPLPDRRHLVADRDRRRPDHARCPARSPTKPGSATLPFFGVQPVVLDPQTGEEITETAAARACWRSATAGRARCAPSGATTQRFAETYFSQYKGTYFTGDGCRRDADGYYWITGRVDDVINVSGHRMGTAEVEIGPRRPREGRRGGGGRLPARASRARASTATSP